MSEYDPQGGAGGGFIQQRIMRRPLPGDATSMFISAALFGYFGFLRFSATPTTMLYQLLVWSLRGAAVGFAIAGVLCVLRVPLGLLVYFLVSAATVVLFVITGVWSLLDPSASNFNGVLLLVFAAWNGSDVYRTVAPYKPWRP